MTAQIHDTLVLDDKKFSLVGVKGDGIFDPETCGLKPNRRACTALWRGYLCHYRIEDESLTLGTLEIFLEDGVDDNNCICSQIARDIDGVSPIASTMNTEKWGVVPTGLFVYRNLNRKIEFTGGLLLGDGFIHDLYVHMGFHPAWKYETVLELIFDRGRLAEKRDVSDRIMKTRRKMLRQPRRPRPGASHQEIRAWIESTFKLDYHV